MAGALKNIVSPVMELQQQQQGTTAGARQTNVVDGAGNCCVIMGNLTATVTIGAEYGGSGASLAVSCRHADVVMESCTALR